MIVIRHAGTDQFHLRVNLFGFIFTFSTNMLRADDDERLPTEAKHTLVTYWLSVSWMFLCCTVDIQSDLKSIVFYTYFPTSQLRNPLINGVTKLVAQRILITSLSYSGGWLGVMATALVTFKKLNNV